VVVLLQLDIAQHNLRNGQVNPVVLAACIGVVVVWI